MAKEFENILSECFDRLIKGESIESCLAHYPQYAAELEPLLKTALETKLAASIEPRPLFRQRAGIEFQEAIRSLPAKKVGGFKWQLRWVAPVAVVLVLLAGGAGTVAAATNALPGSPLYQVKLATESVQMAFTFSEQSKTELYSRFIDYRVEEIVKMAVDGNSDQVEQTTVRMNSQLVAMVDLTSQSAAQGEKSDSFFMMHNSEAANPSVPVPATTTTTVPGTTQPPITLTQTLQAANETPTLNNPAPTNTLTRSSAAEDNTLTAKEQLLQHLQEDMERNLQILREQLEKAPESLKPALEKAIEVLEQGYEQAIANLG
jgi:hypothetical protein